MFNQGDLVEIISKEYGQFYENVGIVMQTRLTTDGYLVAVTNPNNGENVTINVHEDHLSLINDPHPIPQPSIIQFESKYLSEDQIKDIATRVYEERITKFVDDVLERRTPPYGGIVDQVLMATVERYVTKLSDKFETDFLVKAKQVIESTDPGNDEHTSFQEQLVFKLSNVADKCIEVNRSVIYGYMSKSIEDAANRVGIDEFAKKISSKIDVSQIIVDLLREANN